MKNISQILFGILVFFIQPVLLSQELSQDEFKLQVLNAHSQNNVEEANNLIMHNRLLVKPFVDGLIRDCINKELNGRFAEYQQMRFILEKTARSFEGIFSEKSLIIAVNYLTIWSKEQKEKKLIADSLYAVGTKIRGSEPEKAIEIYKKAIEIYRNIGDERGESEILGGLGLIYTNIDYDTSLKYYKEALTKREKVDDRVLIGNTLNSLGSLYYGIFKEYAPALDYFNSAEKVRREIGDSLNLGRTIHLKASTLENLSQFERSLAYYLRSLELNLASGDENRVAESLLKSGSVLNRLGKYQDALESLSKAEKMYTNLGDSTGLSDSYTQIGFVYLRLGDLNATLEKFSQAVNITEKQNDQWGLAGVYNNMGVMLKEAGRYEKALEYANKALDLYVKLQDQASIIICLNNIGTIFFDMKNYPEAEEYHLKGLKICRELKILDQEASYLLNLANDRVMMGKTGEALLTYKEGFEIARTLNNPDLTWKYFTGLAEYYETTGEFEKVVELNDSALNLLDSLRDALQNKELRAFFIAKEHSVFEDVISLLETLHEKDPTKGYDRLAFYYAERSKSRVLLDLITESHTDIKKSTTIKDNNFINPQPVTLDDAKALCQDRNCVILEYSLGDSTSCLWVITRSEHKLLKLPSIEKLQEQIETIRFALLEPSRTMSEFLIQAGTSLYKELIEPAEPFLSRKSKIIIIPDGILNYLPFEVLLTESKGIGEDASFSAAPFLVKKYPISYVQSTSVLRSLLADQPYTNESKTDNKSLIAFGDPVYEDMNFTSSPTRGQFNRLEFSAKEVNEISSFFKEGLAEIYLRENATEENVKRNDELKKFNYIHFATHGSINEDKPDFSSLVLTKRENSSEDGFLQETEIFNLDLNAELVVLSACQSGVGKMIRGEGMISLTRAFMYAGAPSVLVSLWNVSDISTASLMGKFYEHLIKNKLSKIDALRKAQLALIRDEKYSHPFYWAPFILIGDWR